MAHAIQSEFYNYKISGLIQLAFTNIKKILKKYNDTTYIKNHCK